MKAYSYKGDQTKTKQAVGCVVKVSARWSEGRRFDTRLHQLSD